MYVEPASAQAIALRREGARHVLQPRGRSCRVAPATTDAHRSAWRLIGSSRVRPRRRSGSNAPGGNAARTGLGRATYAQCGLHCAALRTMSGRRAIHGAVGDAKGRQAMHGVADDARSGRRCTGRRAMHEWRTMHERRRTVHGERRRFMGRRAIQRSGGRCEERRAMHGAVGDSKKRRTMQRSGERCMVSVRQYTDMVYDARSGGRCMERRTMRGERQAMH